MSPLALELSHHGVAGPNTLQRKIRQDARIVVLVQLASSILDDDEFGSIRSKFIVI